VEPLGRVFAAVPLPDEIRMALREELSEVDIPGKLVPLLNWHITVRFLGVIDEPTYERFLMGLDGLSEIGSFSIRLDRLGAFPNPRKATVVWAGFGEGEARLAMINEKAEESAQGAGVAPEERPFHPHLTLARIRPPRDVRRLLDESLDLTWRCRSVIVYQTRLEGGATRYEPLEVFGLAG
jgi:2'-5' RNA ligase